MTLDRTEAFLRKLYDRKISREYDRIIPVVGDEGVGKSTLMLELTWLWQDITGRGPTPESAVERVAWDTEEFKQMLAHGEGQSVITVQDAARVLHKRKAMHPDQIELENDLLDVRMKEHVMLLGFQDWDIIPTALQTRRAKNLLYIPQRGRIWGYSREGIDERCGQDDWPEPAMRDTFPSLEGTELWQLFKEVDLRKKRERIDTEPDKTAGDGDDELGPKDVVERIKDGDTSAVVSIARDRNEPMWDKDLIEVEFDISARDAKKVRKLLRKDSTVRAEQFIAEA